jgi:hypothetical protein
VSPPIKVHLFGLLAGERFTLALDPDAPIYSIVAGPDPDSFAFRDETGSPISSRAIATLNGGSLFVYPFEPERGDRR